MIKIFSIFVFYGPILGSLVFVFKLGTLLIIGIPLAYLFGSIPAAIASGLFIALARLQQRLTHEPKLTKPWAAILGVLGGAGGAILSLLTLHFANRMTTENFGLLLIPSMFAGAICGILAREHINGSSIYFGTGPLSLRTQQEVICCDCVCSNDISSVRCTCCGAILLPLPDEPPPLGGLEVERQ